MMDDRNKWWVRSHVFMSRNVEDSVWNGWKWLNNVEQPVSMVMIWSHPNETIILICGCFGYQVHDMFGFFCEESSSHVKVPKMYLTRCCFKLSIPKKKVKVLPQFPNFCTPKFGRLNDLKMPDFGWPSALTGHECSYPDGCFDDKVELLIWKTWMVQMGNFT